MMETTTADGLKLSERAAKRIAELAAGEADPSIKLRIEVTGGGCSGFQYGFAFDSAMRADDRLFERSGARVVIDETSLSLMAGAELDFVEDLAGAAFQIRNPNAQSSCGCGNSFSIG